MRDRGQVPAAEPADLSLDPALLVRALDPGLAVEGVEAVVRPQRHEARVLEPFPTQRAPDHRGLEVVVADHPARCPTERGERAHVPVQERLLGLVGVGVVERTAGVRQAHAEHPQPQHHPAYAGAELTEVDLGLLTRRVLLDDHHLGPRPGDLGTKTRHEVAHRGLGHHRSFLLHQPLPHPAGGVPLLARRVQVLRQPGPHELHVRTRDRRLTLGHLPGRWDRVSQRRTHRAPVHPVLPGELSDRQAFIAPVASDTFELLHSRSLLHPPHLRDRLGRRSGQ